MGIYVEVEGITAVAAAAVDEADWDAQNGVDTDVGNEAVDDNVEGDLYVVEAAAAVATVILDCSGCTSATRGARYLKFEFEVRVECFVSSGWEVATTVVDCVVPVTVEMLLLPILPLKWWCIRICLKACTGDAV